MYNPLTPQIARIHQDSLLKEANMYRKPGVIWPATHGLESHILVRLGDLLIAAGLKLHERYKPPVCSDLKPFQTGLTGR